VTFTRRSGQTSGAEAPPRPFPGDVRLRSERPPTVHQDYRFPCKAAVGRDSSARASEHRRRPIGPGEASGAAAKQLAIDCSPIAAQHPITA
jgi:hypothetical protein